MRSKLLKGASLLWGRVARRDDPDDFFMAYHMHDKQERLGFRTPNSGVPFKRDTVQTVPDISNHSVLTKAIRC